MNTSSPLPWLTGGAALVLAGMVSLGTALSKSDGPKAPPADADSVRKPLNKKETVFFEKQGDTRRVVVVAAVCLRQGRLEGLLTRKGTKEHEYILAADVDARDIHAGLVAAGASPGAPVQFNPRYVPAHGTAVKISLRYEKDGKTVTVPAREWVRNAGTKKDLDMDWVFAGSVFQPDPDDKDKQLYLANQGDLVCVCNIDTAMLDLPVRSPKRPDDRVFDAHTDRIPPLETRVEVVFEPVPEKPEKGK
jgi:hypothetical protein